MLIKLSKAAKMLDVHRDTMRRYVRQGIVKGIQLPTGHWRVEDSSIHEILNKTIETQVDELFASF